MAWIKYILEKSFIKIVVIVIIVFGITVSFNVQKEKNIAEDIRLAQQKGINFLKRIQRNNGAICDTVNPLFETWETILAVTAIYRHSPDTNLLSVKNGLVFLKSNENDEGLICHNQKCNKTYCLETTAVYFNLLMLTGKNEKVLNGTKKITVLQKQTGEWDIGNPDVTIQKNFPSVTAFLLNLLQDAGVEPAYKKEAINWLLKKQTAQGDWGKDWEYYGCAGYALWPVIKVLQNENTKEAKLAKEKAIAFILATQNSNGGWF